MAKKTLVLVFTLLVSLSLFAADPKMAVVPAAGDSDAAEMAKNLSKELKNVYKVVKKCKPFRYRFRDCRKVQKVRNETCMCKERG